MLGNGCGMVNYVRLTVAEVGIGPAHHLLLEHELESATDMQFPVFWRIQGTNGFDIRMKSMT